MCFDRHVNTRHEVHEDVGKRKNPTFANVAPSFFIQQIWREIRKNRCKNAVTSKTVKKEKCRQFRLFHNYDPCLIFDRNVI